MAVERIEHLGLLLICDARAILFPVHISDNKGFFNRPIAPPLTRDGKRWSW